MSGIDNIPLSDLSRMDLGTLSPEDRRQAKARMKASNDRNFDAQAEDWLKRQMPASMKQPFAATIPINDRPAVGSLTFMSGRIPGSRKLAPGEVVAVDGDWPDVKIALARKSLELTTEAVTRPLVYATRYYAEGTRPSAAARMADADPAGYRHIRQEEAKAVRAINEQLVAVRAKRGRATKLDLDMEAAEIASTAGDEPEPPAAKDPRASGLNAEATARVRATKLDLDMEAAEIASTAGDEPEPPAAKDPRASGLNAEATARVRASRG
jgi:hypothetical protein